MKMNDNLHTLLSDRAIAFHQENLVINGSLGATLKAMSG